MGTGGAGSWRQTVELKTWTDLGYLEEQVCLNDLDGEADDGPGAKELSSSHVLGLGAAGAANPPMRLFSRARNRWGREVK